MGYFTQVTSETPIKIEEAPADEEPFTPSDSHPLSSLRTQITVNGHRYRMRYDGKREKLLYCSHAQRYNCNGKAKLIKATGQIEVTKEHSSSCINAHSTKDNMVKGADGLFDATEYQKQRILELSEELDMTAGQIYQKITTECKKNWGKYYGLKKNSVSRVTGYWQRLLNYSVTHAIVYCSLQVLNKVYNDRKAAHGSDKLRAMEEMYMSPKGSSASLMQYNVAYADSKGPQRVIGFGRMELVNLLRTKKSQLHIDATFDCCPKDFHQCLIISIYLDTLRLFLPCFYVLMTRKTRRAYIQALSSLNNLLDGAMDPKYIMHDFELAMRYGIEAVFPRTHW